MKHHEISVVMPVYNGGAYLLDAINSILNQSFENFELIIVDDASTDGSAELVKKIRDSRIQLIQNKQNQGVSAASNQGIAASNGRYIARMDCDDISLPTRLEEQFRLMEANPQYGVCGTGTIVVNANGSFNHERQIKESDQEIKIALLLGECSFAHPTVLMRRELLERHELLYNRDYDYAEDYELWCRGSVLMNYVNIPKALVKYRVHPSSISQAYSQQQRECAKKILRQHLERLMIPYSKEELDCHIQFALPMGEPLSEIFLCEIKKWKNKLIQIQNQLNLFDSALFKSEIEIRYQKILLRKNTLGG